MAEATSGRIPLALALLTTLGLLMLAAPAPAAEGAHAIDDLVAVPSQDRGVVELAFTDPRPPPASPSGTYEVWTSKVPLNHQGDPPTGALSRLRAQTGAQGRIRLRIDGLEPDQTYRFAVRAVGEGRASPWSMSGYGVSAHSGGRHLEPPPRFAASLRAPGRLNSKNGYYRLQNDIHADGTAFEIAATGITLDLGGHTVSYGEGGGDDAYGVLSRYKYNPENTIRILNGVIRYAGKGGKRCEAIRFEGGWNVEVRYVNIEVDSPDARGIHFRDWKRDADSSIRVSHCRVSLSHQIVSNRHAGVEAIKVEGTEGAVEVDHCLIDAAPQWGIKIAGRVTRPGQQVLVHHNRVDGTRGVVTNAYMIGAHKPGARVFDNVLRGESAGIHLEGHFPEGQGAQVQDNSVNARMRSNAEYPRYWCHGIKVERADHAVVRQNRVRVVADAAHAEARALDLDLGGITSCRITRNVVQAVSPDGSFLAKAVRNTQGAARPEVLSCTENVFVSTDMWVSHGWDAKQPVRFRGNWWVRLVPPDSARPFVSERFNNGDKNPCRGNGFVDPVPDPAFARYAYWPESAPFDSTRAWPLRLRVQDQRGRPLPDVGIEARRADDTLVAEMRTDSGGRAEALIVQLRLGPGDRRFQEGPIRVRVLAPSGALETTVVPDGPTALVADLGAGTLAEDRRGPPAVTGLSVRALSPTRVLVRWDPPAGEVDSARHLVTLDGEPAAITGASPVVLGGIVGSRSREVGVSSVSTSGRRAAPVRVRVELPPLR